MRFLLPINNKKQDFAFNLTFFIFKYRHRCSSNEQAKQRSGSQEKEVKICKPHYKYSFNAYNANTYGKQRKYCSSERYIDGNKNRYSKILLSYFKRLIELLWLLKLLSNIVDISTYMISYQNIRIYIYST